MSKRIAILALLCFLPSACSRLSLSPECERHYALYADYLSQLEATGRFPPEKIRCFRQNITVMQEAHRYQTAQGMYPPEQYEHMCRGSLKNTQELMKKAEEIPGLSQEAFDADWGRMTCSEL